MSGYEQYLLSDNPFPKIAVIDPYSKDDRINGCIFQEAIFEKEIESLEAKTERGLNLVYLSGIEHDKGIGKSALLINQWRKCVEIPNSTSIYIKCDEKDKPKDICSKIICVWHQEEIIWDIFKQCLNSYAEEKRDPLLAPDAVRFLLNSQVGMPNRLPLTLYTQIRDVQTLAKGLSKYLHDKCGVDSENIVSLLEYYLTDPVEFPSSLNSRKIDPIDVFGDLVKVFGDYGYERHFVFLDQFEDMIVGTQKRGIGRFCLALKKVILSTGGMVSFFVTLHPNSEMLLKIPEARDLTGVAPLNMVHRVDVMVLDTKGDKAVTLAEEYFNHFRTGDPPYTTFPVEKELVELICYLERGNIRRFLQQMHHCLEHGSYSGLPEITLDYALENSSEVFGREVNKRVLERFDGLKGRQRKSSRSMEALISKFKKDNK